MSNGTGGSQVVALPAGNCAMSTPCTWTQIKAAFPAAAVYGRFLLKAGSGAGWVGFDGNADNLTVGSQWRRRSPTTSRATARRAATCGRTATTPTPASADTAAQAKKTIQAAVNQVSAGGTVHVAAGTYVEQVDIGKQLTLDGAGAGSTIIQVAGACWRRSSRRATATSRSSTSTHTGGTIAHLTVDGNGEGNANYRLRGHRLLQRGGTVATTRDRRGARRRRSAATSTGWRCTPTTRTRSGGR